MPVSARRASLLSMISGKTPPQGLWQSFSVSGPASPPASERPEVGRLAPSPTGLLHLGHARTFLLAWWRARSTGGSLLMRLEDLDGPRCTKEMAEASVRDLAWLGLDWDGPSYVQSSGLTEIHQAARRLA